MKGTVRALFVTPEKKAKPISVEFVETIEKGFKGDYHSAFSNRRQILIMPGSVLDELRLKPGAVFENVVLAEYRCHYNWRDRKVTDIREAVFYPTRFASPQGSLLPVTAEGSVVVYRARAARRRAPHLPPAPQLLLFEVVTTG